MQDLGGRVAHYLPVRAEWMQVAGMAALLSPLLVLFGGWDTLLRGVLALIIIDVLTGVLKAVRAGTLASTVARIGLARKLALLLAVWLTTELDRVLVAGLAGSFGTGPIPVLRTLTCLYVIGTEGLSIVENLAQLGVLLPKPVLDALGSIERRGPGATGPPSGGGAAAGATQDGGSG